MARPESDVDVKGICIPPSEYFHGYLKHFEQFEGQLPRDATFGRATYIGILESMVKRQIPEDEPIDSVVYDLRKFFRLAADCNPNICEVMFTDPSCQVWSANLYELLVGHRNDFLSTKAKFSFCGYAHAQLKRIRTHRAWLLNPPKAKPTRADFGLPEHTVIPRDQLMAAESLITRKLEEWLGSQEELPKDVLHDLRQRTAHAIRDIWAALAAGCLTWVGRGDEMVLEQLAPPITEDGDLDDQKVCHAAGKLLGYDSNFLEVLDRERGYRSALKQFNQYEEWKRSRNPARAALEEKHGFDTKHGSHLKRLLDMAKEIIEDGKVIVKRPNAEELLAIRNGAWSFDQLLEWATQREEELDALYEAGKSPLPKKPNHAKLDELCCLMAEAALQ
jgi:predicted nucleotidyltransferase